MTRNSDNNQSRMHVSLPKAAEVDTGNVAGSRDLIANVYRTNATAARINTDLTIYQKLEGAYPRKHITMVSAENCNLFGFQASGQVQLVPTEINGTTSGPLSILQYLPPASRADKSSGSLGDRILFGRYEIIWQNHPEPFILYFVEGRDGSDVPFGITRTNYIISDSPSPVQELILAAGKYNNDLHGEIWVFDQGFWRKNRELWDAIDKARWDVVILEEKMKKQLIRDFNGFFDSQDTYKRLKVPWKRGLIFHGPPGNGKTISLKAAMHMLYQRKVEVSTLYVKTLTNFRGPEQSLNDIFAKARATSPCLLVFEDLDSIVSDSVRSFFLNQVDGLATNDGILMVGSTNHLERLDPGISKRPSRFDRKYLFSNPDFDQRVMYAQFWRRKLGKTDHDDSVEANFTDSEIEFPEKLCKPIAKITDKFSFAYMQEAFVATLLKLARNADDDDEEDGSGSPLAYRGDDKDPDIEKLALWKEFQKQAKILRDQIGDGKHSEAGSKKPISAMASWVQPTTLAQPTLYQMAKPTYRP